MSTVLLYSGGLDSTVLLYELCDQNRDVCPFAIDYGQRHAVELFVAQGICAALDLELVTVRIGVPWLGQTVDGLIFPNRNAVLVSLAAAYALRHGYETVAFAAHAGDHNDFPDCRIAWADAMDDVLRAGTDGAVSLSSPYMHLTKKQIVQRGRQLGVPFEQTWSCYGPGPEPCGTCLACRSRSEALA